MYVFETKAAFDQIDSFEEDKNSGRISAVVLDHKLTEYAKYFILIGMTKEIGN